MRDVVILSGARTPIGSFLGSLASIPAPRLGAAAIGEALGAAPPQFAHVPLILGPDKKRLSKRHGATSVLDARLGISATDAGKEPPLIGGPSMRELYGITGLPENDPSITGGLTPQSITGYTQLGRQSTNPQFQNPSNINPRVTLTNVFGRHTVKFGFRWAREIGYKSNPQSNRFTFPSLDDLLANKPSDFLLAMGNPPHRAWVDQFGGFIQDDWRVSDRFVLNLGLRYDYYPGFGYKSLDPDDPAEINNLNNPTDIRRMDFGAPRPLDKPIDDDKMNFAPRAGGRAEQVLEAEAAEVAHEDVQRIGEIEPGEAACAARTAAHAGVAVAIVRGALLRIAQHLVHQPVRERGGRGRLPEGDVAEDRRRGREVATDRCEVERRHGEDEPLERMFLPDFLDEAGFKVFEAVSADEALALLQARPDIQAVVTDIEMPGFHSGLDFCGGEGLQITAPAAGRVVFSAPLTVRGNATIIDHGRGVYSGFWHQSQMFVNVGDMVEQGQVIGLVGGTGRVTGAHLHWEVWVNGVQVDPLEWLNQVYP